MPATLTRPRSPGAIRQVASDPRYREVYSRLKATRDDLAAVRAEIAKLKETPAGDETEAAAQAIARGEKPIDASAVARDALNEAQKRELSLVRAVEILENQFSQVSTTIVREIHGEQSPELRAKVLAVAQAVSEVGVAIGDLGGFLQSMAAAGAPFPNSAWGVVLGHTSDCNILKLPKPEQAPRAIERYLSMLAKYFPDLRGDLAALQSEWEG